MSKKTYIEVKKTSDNVRGKPTCGFSPQHNKFSALNYAQDLGTTVKESLKRTTSSKSDTLTKKKSNCPVSNTFMPLSALSTMSLPLVQTVIEFANRIPKIMVQFCYLRLYIL